MEKYVKFLITLSTVTAILLVLVVIAVIIHYLRTRSMAEKLLNNGKRNGDFVTIFSALTSRKDGFSSAFCFLTFCPTALLYAAFPPILYLLSVEECL